MSLMVVEQYSYDMKTPHFVVFAPKGVFLRDRSIRRTFLAGNIRRKGGLYLEQEKNANFSLNISFIDNLAQAGIPEEYRNPLLTWIKLIFADDKPNANSQGIGQDEFPNLIRSMMYMPVKAKLNPELGLQGHFGADIVGVIKAGQQEANSIVAIGALYNDEYPEIVDFCKKEIAEGRKVDFSWEIRYKDSETKDGTEWLKGTTTKAVTAVQNPAYNGRTSLVSISSFDELLLSIDEELKRRNEVVA